MDCRVTAPVAMVGTDRRAVRRQMIGAPGGRTLPKTPDENRQAERLPYNAEAKESLPLY